MSVFETETMAELCVKQGLLAEAREIYRRLVEQAPDELTRARRQRRALELAAGAAPAAPAAKGQVSPDADAAALRVQRRGEELLLEWRLPAARGAAALQLLLLRRTADGVQAESRTLKLEASRGRTAVRAANLHSVRAAAGWMDGDRFVPVVRTSWRT